MSRFFSHICFWSTKLWSLSLYFSVIDCWISPPLWLDQSSLIMILVTRCDRKLYMRYIQTIHMDLLTPQALGRSWLGCRLVIFTFHEHGGGVTEEMGWWRGVCSRGLEDNKIWNYNSGMPWTKNKIGCNVMNEYDIEYFKVFSYINK